MCMCICMCVCVCIFVCVRICVYVCMYILYVCMCVRVFVFVCLFRVRATITFLTPPPPGLPLQSWCPMHSLPTSQHPLTHYHCSWDSRQTNSLDGLYLSYDSLPSAYMNPPRAKKAKIMPCWRHMCPRGPWVRHRVMPVHREHVFITNLLPCR